MIFYCLFSELEANSNPFFFKNYHPNFVSATDSMTVDGRSSFASLVNLCDHIFCSLKVAYFYKMLIFD